MHTDLSHFFLYDCILLLPKNFILFPKPAVLLYLHHVMWFMTELNELVRSVVSIYRNLFYFT